MAGVAAFRDIEPGEEITISCTWVRMKTSDTLTSPDPGIDRILADLSPNILAWADIPHTDTSEERKTKLDAWEFTCSCDLCAAPKAQVAASDKRRKRLAQGVDLMVAALQRGDVRGGINTLREALKVLEEEGLEPLSGEVYEGLARIYWAVGDKKAARKFAIKAVDYSADFGGSLEPSNRTADVEGLLRSF